MKVALDISQIAHPGGVANYTQHLSEQLTKDKSVNWVFFYSSLRKRYQGNLPNVRSFKIPPSLFEIVFNRIRFVSIESFVGDIDIFHSSDWVQPKTKAKKVTTYHDLVALKYPQWSDPKIVEVHKRRLKLVEEEIDLVIAVSEATRNDLISISKIDPKKIKVIYEGVDSSFTVSDKEKVQEFKKRLNLPDDFVLAVGGVGSRKNLNRIKQAAAGYNLVITGETIPWVSQGEMPLLYAAAEVLLYPSLHEGFGLPILEAMACGTPVITSNTSSMPEVGGRAALYVNSENVSDIKEKLDLILKDSKLRQELIDLGFNQVKKFTWEKCAFQTIQSYKELFTNK